RPATTARCCCDFRGCSSWRCVDHADAPSIPFVPAEALGHAHIFGSPPRVRCVSCEDARHTVPSPAGGEGTLWHRSSHLLRRIRVRVLRCVHAVALPRGRTEIGSMTMQTIPH